MTEAKLPTQPELRSNRAPWLAFLLALAAMGLTLGFFFDVPGKGILAWLTPAAAVAALVWGVIGIKRAFARPRVYGGKITAPIFGVISLLVCGFLVSMWFGVRNLPASSGAPQVGQKAPDFTLSDTTGDQVTLTQLLAAAPSNGLVNVSKGNAAAPRAVLLVFYRGYW